MRNRKKLAIFIITAVLVLGAGGFGTAFAMFDAFKSPKLIYLESELQDSKNREEQLSKFLKTYQSYVLNYVEKPVHTEVGISDIKVDSPVLGEEAAKLLEIINDSKLIVSSDIDEKNKKAYGKYDLIIKGNSLLNLEYFRNGDTVGFGLPDVYSKYGYIDLADTETLEKQFGMEDLPKRLVTYNDIVDAISISEKELKPITKKYAKLYADSLEDSQITLSKDGVFEEDDSKIKSREITVTFTERQLKDLLETFADELASDKELHDLLYSRYKNMSQLMVDSGYDIRVMDKDDFLSEIEDAHEQFLDELQAAEMSEEVKMTLFVDRQDNILERKITFDINEGDNDYTVTFKYANWLDQDNQQNRLVSFKTKSDRGTDSELKWTYKAEETKEKIEGKSYLSIEEFSGAKSESLVGIDVDFSINTSKGKKDGDISFKASVKEDGTDQGTLKGTVTIKEVSDKNGKIGDYSVSLDLSELTNDALKAVSFKVETTEKVGEEVKLPEMTASNSINLAKISEEDEAQLQQELMAAFADFTNKNEELIQELNGISDSLPAAEMFPSDEGGDYDYEDEATDYDTDAGILADNVYIEDLINGYEWAIIDAINNQDFSLVEGYFIPESNMYYAQQELVQNLTDSGVSEELINYEISSIEPSEYENEYYVYTTETVTVRYADGTEETNDYSWIYSVYMDSEQIGITDIQPW